MKKSLLVLFLSILLFPVILSAQADTEDVIYLKNGSVYRGTITEQEPGKSYKIKITGGSIISIAAPDVERITREARPETPEERMRRSHHNRRVKRERYAKIEATGSGLLYFRQPFGPTGNKDIAGGGGLSFMTEIGRRGGSFTLVTGVAAQFLNLHNFRFTRSNYYYNFDYGDIGTGVQTRFQIPIWLRWTFGQRMPVFFQFGFSAGFNCYQGRGSEITGSSSGGYPPVRTYGWQKYYDGYINLSSVGIGFKKKLSPALDLVIYAQGSPAQLLIMSEINTIYQPYLELHAGISFDPGRYRQSKKIPLKNP